MSWKQPSDSPVTPRAAANARALRRQMTEPERRLWWHLRHRLPIDGSHFRRQVPIGHYVVDFCCPSRRLIVEVDGNQHGSDTALAYDAARTTYLEGQGFRVLRFSNFDVMRGIEVVLDTIHAVLTESSPQGRRGDASFSIRSPGGATPTPDPSPQGGGESAHPIPRPEA